MRFCKREETVPAPENPPVSSLPPLTELTTPVIHIKLICFVFSLHLCEAQNVARSNR